MLQNIASALDFPHPFHHLRSISPGTSRFLVNLFVVARSSPIGTEHVHPRLFRIRAVERRMRLTCLPILIERVLPLTYYRQRQRNRDPDCNNRPKNGLRYTHRALRVQYRLYIIQDCRGAPIHVICDSLFTQSVLRAAQLG